ncbi:MAG: CorA family divalent cation transporter [Candidatus Bathyarchaeia archaeon]
MIWTYTLTKLNELQARDADSLGELQRLGKEAKWVWIDALEPDDKERETIARLLKEAEILSAIKKKQIFSHRQRVNDYFLISIPSVAFNDILETHPIYVFAKEKTLITIRSKNSSKCVDNTLDTFRDCLSKVCQYSNASSFVVGRLLHEVSDENLDAVMALKARTEEIEEKALANPGDKKIGKTVFALKREISGLERILWTQKELMLSVQEGVIPAIQSSELDAQTLNNAVTNVSRQISLLTSNDDSLDSILRLQDLGMIHRVERILIYLTLLTLIVSIITILIQVDIVKILSG